MNRLNCAGATFSLTPRLIAVKNGKTKPETVSTVSLPAQMSVSKATVRLKTSRESNFGGGKLLKQFTNFESPLFTAINRGVNENLTYFGGNPVAAIGKN
jgi:hypothetical protein